MDRLVDRAGTELGHGLDSGQVQAARLIATHAGDQAEVIVLATARFADVDPAADAAVVDRIWIGPPTLPFPNGRGKNDLFELALHAPVVRRIVLQAQLFLGAVAQDQRDVL